jgi:hypothetical protein
VYRTANRELLETVEMTKRNAERNPKKPQSGLTAQEQISIDKYLARKAASTAPRVKLNGKKKSHRSRLPIQTKASASRY